MQVRPWPPKYYAHYAEISKQCKIRSLSKVVVTFYLRWRNEFQPFTAKNQRSNGWVNQRPGVWWEMAGIHFSISDKRFFLYTSNLLHFGMRKPLALAMSTSKQGKSSYIFQYFLPQCFSGTGNFDAHYFFPIYRYTVLVHYVRP